MRLRFVQAWVDGGGRAHHYFRRPGWPRVRLPGLPGSAEFMATYAEALAARPEPVGAGRTNPGSLNAVVAEYYDSQQYFASKSPGTQRMRRSILERFRAAHGDKPIALLPPEFIERLLDNKPPQAARSWLMTLRSLCAFAVKRGWLRTNPAANVKVASVKSDGFHTWTDDEIAAFEAHYSISSKPRLALALLLYTMQRRGDVIRMGRQHIRQTPDGERLYVRQQKTGKELMLPIRPELRVVLDATPSEHLTFLTTATGKPFSGNHFAETFREWCDVAGLPKRCKVHGLRKAGCRRAAEDGWSANEIAAWSGHASLREVERYTRAADQARLAANAMTRTMRGEQNGTRAVKL